MGKELKWWIDEEKKIKVSFYWYVFRIEKRRIWKIIRMATTGTVKNQKKKQRKIVRIDKKVSVVTATAKYQLRLCKIDSFQGKI